MKRLFTVLAVLLIGFGNAQETGTIAGKLLDKESNNQPLPFANVIVKGTTKGSSTDFDGLYEINGIPVGTYTIEFSFTGYQTVEVPNVRVEANKISVVDATMGATAAALEEVVIKVVTNREREEALLLEQKNAVEIKQAIGAQELARKGVGDAEGAVSKISGVSKQEGVKNVFVRGLGDRYNATTLNGLPLPSEDPEYKNIALDLFSSDAIQAIGVSKNYTASNYGDMGGAIIDIQSKELTGKSLYSFTAGTGFNSIAFDSKFQTMDEGNWVGTVDERTNTITDLNSYDFNNSFSIGNRDFQTNTSLGFQVGKRFDVRENRLSTFLSGSSNSEYFYHKGINRVINAQGGLGTDFNFNESIYKTSKLLMGNFKYSFYNGNVSYNSILIHRNEQSVGDYLGFQANVSEEADAALVRRQQQNEDIVFVNQLLSELNLNAKTILNLGVSYNTTRGYEPDRRTNTYTLNGETYLVALGASQFTNRFYSDLEENDLAAKASLAYEFGKKEKENSIHGTVRIGANFRQTDREFNFTQFNFDVRRFFAVDIDNPDSFFNQESLDQNRFFLLTSRGTVGVNADPLSPFFYTGDRTIYSGFINSDLIFNDKLSLGIGLRFENVNQTVAWDTNLSSSVRDLSTDPSELDETYILPSLSAKYSFSENSIFRLAGSRTYTFPQFKEVAPFLYEDVTFASVGFPELEPSTNYNLDLKYEFYFSSSEVISINGFYKIIQDPINRIAINSAANNLSYRNTGDDATVAGIEFEMRKNIIQSKSEDTYRESTLAAGLNASYLYSNQELDSERSQANFTAEEDELEGASPFLVNADITYTYTIQDKIGLTSSVVLNYFSDRIYSLGTQNQRNIVEKGIPTLDFITKVAFNNTFGFNLGIRNILNPEYELNQEILNGNTIPIRTFKKGIVTSLAFTYNF